MLRVGMFAIKQVKLKKAVLKKQVAKRVPTDFVLISLLGVEVVCAKVSAARWLIVVRSLSMTLKGVYWVVGGVSMALTNGSAIFNTTDRCDGTLIEVGCGCVLVLVKGHCKFVIVKGGCAYFVKVWLFVVKQQVKRC